MRNIYSDLMIKMLSGNKKIQASWKIVLPSKIPLQGTPCSKTPLDCSTLGRFLSAIRSYMLNIPNSAEGNCLEEKENHTSCLKSDIKSKKL